jgi:hypothetical protein
LDDVYLALFGDLNAPVFQDENSNTILFRRRPNHENASQQEIEVRCHDNQRARSAENGYNALLSPLRAGAGRFCGRKDRKATVITFDPASSILTQALAINRRERSPGLYLDASNVEHGHRRAKDGTFTTSTTTTCITAICVHLKLVRGLLWIIRNEKLVICYLRYRRLV